MKYSKKALVNQNRKNLKNKPKELPLISRCKPINKSNGLSKFVSKQMTLESPGAAVITGE